MHDPAQFAANAARAARNTALRGALARASGHFRQARARGMAELAAWADPEAMREQIRLARLRTLQQLPELLELLEANLRKQGVQVHWAADAQQAREIIVGLAREHGVQSVVKGKSMITEEIGLNPVLEQAGLEVWETDLGEYIIQLAGEPPSHIIAPAVHKTREEVAELFREAIGRTAEDSVSLTAIARDELRQRFLHADMGITGVNMAVADPGALVLIENEGNIRMSTTCPELHVAVMSLEKAVAGLDEAAAILQMLPRSATGQKLASYVSIFSSPRGPDEDDGPRHLHLVILDNGRSSMLADPALRETLLCVRCGACLAACPVYRSVGGHSYGWAYSGPIGALLGPQLLPHEAARDYPRACTMCGNCKDVCPVGIDHPRMLLELRRRYAEEPGYVGAAPGAMERLGLDALSWALTHPRSFRAGMGLARRLDPEFRLARRLSGRLRRHFQARAPQRLQKPFAALWRTRTGGRRG